MVDDDLLIAAKNWLTDLISLETIVNTILTIGRKATSIDVLVKDLYTIFNKLKNKIAYLRESHRIDFGTINTSSDTRTALLSIYAISENILYEINQYRNGTLNLQSNENDIKSLIVETYKILKPIVIINKSITGWLNEESKKNHLLNNVPIITSKNHRTVKPKVTKDVFAEFNEIKYKTLNMSEPFGLITAPIRLVESNITKTAWNQLKEIKYKPVCILNKHYFLYSAKLIGVSDKMTDVLIKDSSVNVVNLLEAMIESNKRLNLCFGSNYNVRGSIVKKDSHYYMILIPPEIKNKDCVMSNWAFK